MGMKPICARVPRMERLVCVSERMERLVCVSERAVLISLSNEPKNNLPVWLLQSQTDVSETRNYL